MSCTVVRAEARIELEEFEDAVRDYDHATDLEPNSEAYMRGLKKAKLELKKSKRKNYYKILGGCASSPLLLSVSPTKQCLESAARLLTRRCACSGRCILSGRDRQGRNQRGD
eukprot:SAG22_NODE_192_length_15668_cov_4.492389_9_plen_112_part_00